MINKSANPTIAIVLDEGAQMPSRMSDEAAGYDLYVSKDTIVTPNSRTLVPTGVHLQLPRGLFATVRPRSGFSLKGFEGIVPDGSRQRCNADVLIGTIDSDYRGPIGIIVNSYSDVPFRVCAGDRIAQLIIQRHEEVVFNEAGELDTTERGEKGYNSTEV